jgi:hypothetical protein
MASSSDTRSTRIWLEDTHVALRRTRSPQANNERITFVSTLDHRNKRGYNILLFRAPTSQGKKIKQSPYIKGPGMNSSTIAHQEGPTLELYKPTYIALMETVSPQKTNQLKNRQTKTQQHPDPDQKKPVTKNPCNNSHLQLSK